MKNCCIVNSLTFVSSLAFQHAIPPCNYAGLTDVRLLFDRINVNKSLESLMSTGVNAFKTMLFGIHSASDFTLELFRDGNIEMNLGSNYLNMSQLIKTCYGDGREAAVSRDSSLTLVNLSSPSALYVCGSFDKNMLCLYKSMEELRICHETQFFLPRYFDGLQPGKC